MPAGWKGVVAGVDDAVGKGSSRYITICSAIILLHTVLAAPLAISIDTQYHQRVFCSENSPTLDVNPGGQRVAADIQRTNWLVSVRRWGGSLPECP